MTPGSSSSRTSLCCREQLSPTKTPLISIYHVNACWPLFPERNPQHWCEGMSSFFNIFTQMSVAGCCLAVLDKVTVMQHLGGFWLLHLCVSGYRPVSGGLQTSASQSALKGCGGQPSALSRFLTKLVQRNLGVGCLHHSDFQFLWPLPPFSSGADDHLGRSGSPLSPCFSFTGLFGCCRTQMHASKIWCSVAAAGTASASGTALQTLFVILVLSPFRTEGVLEQYSRSACGKLRPQLWSAHVKAAAQRLICPTR